MSSAIERFFNAWGLDDADARAAEIVAVLAATCTYADPRSDGQITGSEAITAYVDMFSANAPGWTAAIVSSDEIAGIIRCTVAFGGPGPNGDMVQHGQYFVEMNGELISRMVGFVGTGAVE